MMLHAPVPMLGAFAASVVANDPAITKNNAATITLVRLRMPRPPNREPIRPLSGGRLAMRVYSLSMYKG
jgi:hypothetical protein